MSIPFFPMGSPMGSPFAATQWEKKPEPSTSDGLHRFPHFAMACDWSIWVPEEAASFDDAQNACEEAFQEITRLEGELSRFRGDSDISRVNAHAGDGEWLVIGADAWECLSMAQDVFHETGGAFDVALARVLEARRREDGTFAQDEAAGEAAGTGATTSASTWTGPLTSFLELETEPFRARLADERAQLDLGAIGKGYALDRALAVLGGWSISDALLHSGQSTVLASGSGPASTSGGAEPIGEVPGGGWRVALRLGQAKEETAELPAEVVLRDAALSGSGRAIQGYHVLDPRSGQAVAGARATWAVTPGFAALSDALSTAFMAMSAQEIGAFCAPRPQLSALRLDSDGARHSWGEAFDCP
jgi:thiamine biosynthesis lipoprotein